MERISPLRTSKDNIFRYLQDNYQGEVPHEVEWLKQARRLAELLAPELGMSEESYIESLPRFSTQPEAYRGRFDFQLIVPVHQKIGIERIAKIAGIRSRYSADTTKDWEGPDGLTTPDVSYTAWIDDGRRSIGVSVDAIREDLANDERGGTVHDGVALFLQNPKILRWGHPLDLPGSQVGNDDAPYLIANSYPGYVLGFAWTGLAHPSYGQLIAGRHINTQ